MAWSLTSIVPELLSTRWAFEKWARSLCGHFLILAQAIEKENRTHQTTEALPKHTARMKRECFSRLICPLGLHTSSEVLPIPSVVSITGPMMCTSSLASSVHNIAYSKENFLCVFLLQCRSGPKFC